MSNQRLPVAKAARKLGIGRKEIQQKIQSGELETFEGKVAVEDLEAVFPGATRVESSAILERMSFIKDNAYSNRVQTAHIPDAYTLLGQVQKLRLELRFARDEKLAHLRLIHELNSQLREMQKICDDNQRVLIGNLLQLIAHGIEKQKS